MTCRAWSIDAVEHAITVAVRAHLDDALLITTGFTFDPQPATAAAKIRRDASGQGLGQRFTRGVSEHQDFTGVVRLRDHGNQAVGIPMQQRSDFARITGGLDVMGHVGGTIFFVRLTHSDRWDGVRRSGVDVAASDRATPMVKVVDGSGRRRLSWTPYQAD